MRILAINSGSSSLKFALYDIDSSESQLLSGSISGIGRAECRFRVRDGSGRTLTDQTVQCSNGSEAGKRALGWLEEGGFHRGIEAVGYRIVHGGLRFSEPTLATAETMAALEAISPIDPEHMPQAIATVREVQGAYPDVSHVLCFDTAFGHDMPAVAQIVPIACSLADEGVIRYGFHGLSYEYIVEQLGSEARAHRVIIAHLGNGASVAAVKDGRCVETTMGFSPTGGLVMSTRSGDLDPSVVLYLLRQKHMDVSEVTALLNKRSGLLGVSGLSGDMQDLLTRIDDDANAALAVELFCYRARLAIGALAAALGGLDMLVFTGGIGENATAVRQRICDGLQFLGVRADENRNASETMLISPDASPVTIRVLKTNEELMIARHTFRLAGKKD